MENKVTIFKGFYCEKCNKLLGLSFNYSITWLELPRGEASKIHQATCKLPLTSLIKEVKYFDK